MSARRPIALTGTPGTGKSSVARLLARRHPVVEVAELGRALGLARERKDGGLTIDLARVARALRTGRLPWVVLVGHLAHLLPVRDVIVLRCHPIELERRLARARRGRRRERRENALSEALDLVLIEALGGRRRVWEIDTTHRSVRAVARDVEARLAHGGRPSYGRIDWLADPKVTREILDRDA